MLAWTSRCVLADGKGRWVLAEHEGCCVKLGDTAGGPSPSRDQAGPRVERLDVCRAASIVVQEAGAGAPEAALPRHGAWVSSRREWVLSCRWMSEAPRPRGPSAAKTRLEAFRIRMPRKPRLVRVIEMARIGGCQSAPMTRNQARARAIPEPPARARSRPGIHGTPGSEEVEMGGRTLLIANLPVLGAWGGRGARHAPGA